MKKSDFLFSEMTNGGVNDGSSALIGRMITIPLPPVVKAMDEGANTAQVTGSLLLVYMSVISTLSAASPLSPLFVKGMKCIEWIAR